MVSRIGGKEEILCDKVCQKILKVFSIDELNTDILIKNNFIVRRHLKNRFSLINQCNLYVTNNGTVGAVAE